MDDLRKAAQAALEALTNCADDNRYGHRCNRCDSEMDPNGSVAEMLRAALAQPDQPAADGPALPPIVIRADHHYSGEGLATAVLAFRAAGVAQERERCAKVCEGPFGVNSALNDEEAYYGRQMAGAIRKG